MSISTPCPRIASMMARATVDLPDPVPPAMPMRNGRCRLCSWLGYWKDLVSGAGVDPSLLAGSRSRTGFSLVARVVEQDGGDGAAGRRLELTLGDDQERVGPHHRGQDARPLGAGETRLEPGRDRRSATARRKCCSFGLRVTGSAIVAWTLRRNGQGVAAHLADGGTDEELEGHHGADRIARAGRSRARRPGARIPPARRAASAASRTSGSRPSPPAPDARSRARPR